MRILPNIKSVHPWCNKGRFNELATVGFFLLQSNRSASENVGGHTPNKTTCGVVIHGLSAWRGKYASHIPHLRFWGSQLGFSCAVTTPLYSLLIKFPNYLYLVLIIFSTYGFYISIMWHCHDLYRWTWVMKRKVNNKITSKIQICYIWQYFFLKSRFKSNKLFRIFGLLYKANENGLVLILSVTVQ